MSTAVAFEDRAYQSDAILRVRRLFAAKKRRVLLVAPTGSGKTIMASRIIALALAMGTRVTFLTHRKELIEQTVKKLRALGIRVGIIKAGYAPDPLAPVQVASIQTLIRRDLPDGGFLIIDEAHHASSDSYRKIAANYRFVLGLTATPWRTDGRGLGDDFDDVVLAATPEELRRDGYLVDAECIQYASPDLKGIRLTEEGDYSPKMLQLLVDRQELQGDVVREYQLHGNGEPGIVFPASVEASQRVVSLFNATGFEARHVDGHTPPFERDDILKRFTTGQLQILSSCGVLTEGFDAPIASVCMIARPTQSLSLFLQMIGRVLRPHPGKTRALIHDHAGNFLRPHLGLPYDERDYTLTADRKRSTTAQHMACPMCSFVVPIAATECPKCGGLLRAPVVPTERREMRQRPEAVRLNMAQIRAARAQQGLRDMSDADLARIATASRYRKCAEYLRLRNMCAARGFPPHLAAKFYAETFQAPPDFTPEELARTTAATRPIAAPPRRERVSLE